MEQASDPPAMRLRVPTGVFALSLGLLIIAVFVTFILFVSNDMRWVLAIGAATLFVSSLWLGSRRRGGFVSFLLLILPLQVLYGAMVVPELPGLWPHLAIWFGFALLGWFGFRSERPLAGALVSIMVLSAVSLAYGVSYVPGEISSSLTDFRDEPAPQFTLDRLDGTRYETEALQGKVVVMDFFATWCAPCIAELPELEEVRSHFEHRDDVAVLIVANDSGGDTPESIRDFIEDRQLELQFAYDPDGTAHTAFGFAGLPGLVVMDRMGRIRLTREGYNSAESGFRTSLVEFVESL